MRFSIAAVLAIATSVFAQTDGFDVITNPYAGEKVLAGKPCEIKWAPSTEPKFQGTVRIDVLGGTTPQTLNKVGTVASGVDSSKGSYKWNVDPHLGTENTYGIQITLESNKEIYQYSFPFHIIGGLPADDDDETTTVAIPTTTATATGTAKPLTLTAPTTTKAATTTAAAETTSAAGSSDSESSASGAVSSFSTVVSSASTSVEASSTSETVATASPSSTVVTGGAAAAFGASTGVVLGGVAMALFAL